jgi:ATP-binding cassette subfamily B multidrug efflux pump
MSGEQYIALDDQDESLVKEKDYSFVQSFAFFYQHAKGRRSAIYLSFTFLIMYAICSMGAGHYMGMLVGDGLAKKNWELATRFSIFFLALELAAILFHYSGRKILTVQSGHVLLNIRKKLFTILPKLPLNYLDRVPQGRIVTRLTHDVEAVEQFFVSSLGRILNAVFLAFVSIATMMMTNVKLALIIIAAMVPSLMLVYFTRHKVGKINRKMSKLSGHVNSRLSEFVDGVFVIRSFGLENWSQDIFSQAVDEHVDSTLEANHFYAMTRPLISFFTGVPLLLLIWFGGNMVLAGTLTLSVFVAFIRYCEKFYFPVQMLFREIHVIISAFTNARRVTNFLENTTEGDIFETGEAHHHIIHGDIEFRNVSMAYKDHDYVLNDVSFTITAGEKIGIVGPTGSGKTSVMAILSRLYDFQKGHIYVDGQDIKEIDFEFLRSQIGLVSQNVTIFSGSLRENLTVDDSISDEKIIEICKRTGLYKVMSLSGLTLDSHLSDAGSNLSAGEKQVVSLTRTCLLSPRILILDEATANIDPYFEEIIHDSVDYLMKGKTSFIIAHRLDTISQCDRLLVFKDGKLVEEGKPSVLMNIEGGHFHQLCQANEFISKEVQL